MSGIFLSYSRADRALADQVVRGLRALDVDVWWDEDMPGVDWQEELKRQLNELSAVLVIWTPASSGSKNVMGEARLGDRKEKLVNVVCGVHSPPSPFDAINALPLDGWTGRERHNGWTRLVRTIEDFLVQSGGAQRGQLTAALGARERAVRDRSDAVDAAVEAYHAAQVEEEAAATIEAGAAGAFEAAEEQLRWMVERHATATVVRAAQADIDAAQAVKDEAQRTRRAAAASLATASRAMTRAKADLERLFDEARPLTPAPERSAAEPPRVEPTAIESVAAEPPAAAAAVVEPHVPPQPQPEPTAAAPVPRPPVQADPPRAPSRPAGPAPGDASPLFATTKPAPAPPPKAPGRVWLAFLAIAGLLALVTCVAMNQSPQTAIEDNSTDASATATSNAAMSDDNSMSAAATNSMSAAATNASVNATASVSANTNSAASSPSDPVAQGEDAFDAKNYKLAFQLLLPAAQNGDADAEDYVGSMYFHGWGVRRNYAEAAVWYQKAADAGIAMSENDLGYLYEQGLGVTRDYPKALALYEKAAAGGLAVAAWNVGALYTTGDLGSVDMAQARVWMTRAAAMGNSSARKWLAENPG